MMWHLRLSQRYCWRFCCSASYLGEYLATFREYHFAFMLGQTETKYFLNCLTLNMKALWSSATSEITCLATERSLHRRRVSSPRLLNVAISFTLATKCVISILSRPVRSTHKDHFLRYFLRASELENLLVDCSPSWEANKFSARQEISRILRKH